MKVTQWSIAADMWLVTKQFSPVSSGVFSFWCRNTTDWYSGSDGAANIVNLEVFVCTNASAPEYSDDFEIDPVLVIEEQNDETDGEYTQHTIDLSAYKGQNIYVGFRVANQSTYVDGWWIDDVDGLGELVSNKEIEAQADFSLFPNPSNRTVTFENISNGTDSVINMNGQEVQRFENVQNNQTIDLNVESGVYFIKANNAARRINIVK